MGLDKPKWTAERITFPADRSLLYRARSTFYAPGEERYVDWLYGDNPAGPVYCWMAMDGDTIAGQYLAVPIYLSAYGKRVKACLSLDTFTHEDYRKQGIFVNLAERVYDDAEADGCAFTIGFPNENSRPGFLKNLKFVEPFTVYRCGKPLPFRKLAGNRLAGRSPLEPRYRITTTDRLDPDWGNALWDELRLKSRWGQWKDGQWLDWRFSQNPRFSYRLLRAEDRHGNPAGYLAWRHDPRPEKEQSWVWVIDVDGVSLGVRLALIRHLVREVASGTSWLRSFHEPLSRYGLPLTLSGFVPVGKHSFIFRPHGSGITGLPGITGHSFDISPALADWL